jgi:hypothetical protein
VRAGSLDAAPAERLQAPNTESAEAHYDEADETHWSHHAHTV